MGNILLLLCNILKIETFTYRGHLGTNLVLNQLFDILENMLIFLLSQSYKNIDFPPLMKLQQTSHQDCKR